MLVDSKPLSAFELVFLGHTFPPNIQSKNFACSEVLQGYLLGDTYGGELLLLVFCMCFGM